MKIIKAKNKIAKKAGLVQIFFSMMILCAGPYGFAAKVSDLLVKKCQEMGGVLVYNWKCPNSGDQRSQTHCMIHDEEGRSMYFNGCSGAIGEYGSVFFQACVYHDFCYHHEPVSNGLTRDDCDSRFYNNMFEICEKQYPQDSDCRDQARWFYNAVVMFGKNAWVCSKEKANYPHGALWLQQLISSK